MIESNGNDQTLQSFLCRLCANVNQNGSYIFTEEVEENLSYLINKYLPLKVEHDGKYPDKICPGCEIQLESTKLFFDLIIDGQKQLKSTFDEAKYSQIFQLDVLDNISSKTGTLEVHSIATGEKYFIQILDDALDNGPLYSTDHEMLATMNILHKEKRKRGRPRKQHTDKKEESVEDSVKKEEENIQPNCTVSSEPLEEGKRHRKIPARFSETVQGKELDDILRKEGIVEEDVTSRIDLPSSSEKEVIGRVENEAGEQLEGPVITKVVSGNRCRRSAIQRRKRKKFKCSECSEEFRTYSRLKLHINKIHGDNNDKVVAINEEHQFKELREENEKNREPLLNTSVGTESETTFGRNSEETSDSSEFFSCKETSVNERNTTSNLNKGDQNEKPFVCKECNRNFSYAKTYEMHLEKHKKGIYVCEVCQKTFNNSSSLVYHRNGEHNNGKRFVCNKCNKTFKHRQLLYRHQLVHTEDRPFKCEICSSAFKSKTNLISHYSKHTGEKNFVCPKCGQTFSYKTSLNLHMRWHRGEKPFTCEICQKRFSQKGNLMEHVRIHTGEKPYCCEICGHNFTTSSQLKLHMKIHTGERPWKCEFCTKTFLHKDVYQEHRRRHTNQKPFQCDFCGKAFVTSRCLKNHMRTHTKEKPNTCDICAKGFSDVSNLIKHRQTHVDKSEENQSQNVSLINTDANNLLYVYYETPKNPNIEVPLINSEQTQSEVVIGSNQDVLNFKEDCMHFQQLVDQEGNPFRLNTQDGQQINVVTSITDGQEKLQGLLPDGTLVALDLQDSKVETMKSLVDQVEGEGSVPHLLLDGSVTFLNENIKPENNILVSEQPNICFVTYDPNVGTIQ